MQDRKLKPAHASGDRKGPSNREEEYNPCDYGSRRGGDRV